MKKFMVAVVPLFFTTAVFAQNKVDDNRTRFYAQAGLAGLDLKVGSATYDIGTTATTYLGVETMGWLGFELNASSAVSQSGTDRLDFLGAYVKPFYKVSEETQIFVRAGTNDITLGSRYGTASRNFSAYGVGANW